MNGPIKNFRRAMRLMVIALIVGVLLAPSAEAAHRRKGHGHVRGHAAVAGGGVGDPRYADIVMDPVTGEVFHSIDPDGRRYPASLTKMMTLYLLFEALQQHKTTIDARMDISEKAASMPQTNLALTPGDSIPVDVAIKALIVRSANDVAWVTGEALGGDIDHFAQMMTAKAHQLGMRNTVFKNPNGLPNEEQHTTARDMAKLGIALKRDFPQYYPLFQTRQFSWNGVTYYTHNRVMLRYAGTDGIKTGFIGASGFNLVSSVVRGGRPLVATVMGGASGGWRDNRMISLLDDTYRVIGARGGQRGKIYAANLPLNRAGQPAGLKGVIQVAAPIDVATADIPDSGEDEAGAENAVGDTAEPGPVATTAPARPVPAPKAVPVAAAPAPKPVVPAPVARPVTPSAPAAVASAPAMHTTAGGQRVMIVPKNSAPPSAAAPVNLARPPAGGGDLAWGIQVGAFSSHDLAEQAAKQAYQVASGPLQGAKLSVIGPSPQGAAVHRARLENISQKQARTACEVLISNNSPCFIYRAGPESL